MRCQEGENPIPRLCDRTADRSLHIASPRPRYLRAQPTDYTTDGFRALTAVNSPPLGDRWVCIMQAAQVAARQAVSVVPGRQLRGCYARRRLWLTLGLSCVQAPNILTRQLAKPAVEDGVLVNARLWVEQKAHACI